MKKSKKISVLISLVLITLLALGAVSAAEDTAVTDDADLAAVDDVQTVDDAPVTDEINYESNDIIVTDTGDSSDLDDAIDDVVSDSTGLQDDSDNGDEAVVSDVASPKNALKAVTDPDEPLRAPDGTFRDLYNLIDGAAAGSTITLDKNYVYTASTDSNYRTGITINKRITIDGAGYTIDGKDTARLFYLDGGGSYRNYQINLRNLNLINGYAYNRNSYGAVIYAYNYPVLNVDNCNFTSNGGSNALGGVIYVATGTTTILHSQLMNNTANYGGVFYIAGGTFNMHGCAVLNNSAQNGDNGYTNGNGNFDLEENWWGENHGIGYTFLNQRGSYYTYFDYYILTETLTSPITIEVDMVLDSGNTPTYALDPRYAKITHDADTCNTTDGWVPEAFTIEFTTGDDAYINVTVDNQKLALKVFAGENKKNITELRVVVDDVILPAQPVAHVYSDVDGVYNLTLGENIYPVTVTNGEGTYQFRGLNVGQYTVIVSRVDDPVYKTTFNTTEFEVKRYATQLSIDTETPTTTYGTAVTITHELTPNGPTGFITYYVDGSETGTQLGVNEDFVLSGLAAGTHTVVAKYGGDGSYDVSQSEPLTIVVNPATLEFNVTNVTVNYPNKGTVNVTSNVDGIYTVTVNNVDYQVTVGNGKGSFEVDQELQVGEYVISWNIPAGNYTAASGTGFYNVTAPAPEFDITGSAEINYGQTNTITHTITEGATGTITYTVNGANKGTLGLDENLVLENLDAGHYVVVAAYSGGGNYGPTSDTFEFDVLKLDVSVTVTSPEVLYPGTGSISLTASAAGTYTVKVGDKTYTAVVETAGVAVDVPVTDNFEVGQYDISVTAPESTNYNAVDTGKIGTYNVVKPATNLIIDVTDFIYGADASATITLKQGGTALADKTITVTIEDTQKTFPTDANGQATVPLSALKAGDHYIVAVFAGDENYALAINSTKVTVNKATPTITVSAEAITYGADATINIGLDGVNDEKITGVVKVTVDSKEYDVVVTNGVGTLTVSGLATNAEGYTITATFAGNDNYGEATGTGSVVVNKADATVTVSADKDSIKFGETATLSSVVTPGDDDGAVTYYVDGTAITGTTVSGLSVGEHTVVAKVAATDNYNEASSEALTITVEKADATITVSADETNLKYGESTTVSSVVSPSDDGGAVTYYVDGTAITGTTVSGLSVGTHTVVAKVAETANYNAAESEALTITVAKADATIELTIDDNELTFGESTTVSSVVSPSGDDGAVTYYVDGTAITGTTVSGLSVGTHTVVAKVAETANYNAAESAAKTITVSKATPEITITSEPVTYPSDAIVNIVLTGANSAALPDATIRVTINGTTYAVTTDNDGKASLTVKGLNVGEYAIAAVSVADNSYNSATYDGSTKVVVNKADATITVSADKTSIKYGESTTVSSVVTPGDDDGAVTYYVDGTAITGTTVSGLSVGEHTVVAKVAATDNYNEASSEALTITVEKADATITVSADKETIKFGETATLSSVVTPGDDDGVVTYYLGETALDSNVLSGLAPGTYTVVAKVAATANYNEATSEALTITVERADASIEVVITDNQLTFGESTTVSSIITPEGLTGDVTYYVDGTAITGDTVSDLSVGTHTVVAKLAETTNYNAAESAAKTITVSKATPEITITSDPVTFPTQATVVVNANVPGTYTIRVGNKDYAVVVGDTGSGSALIDVLQPGTYEIDLRADLGPNYNPVVQIPAGTLTVNPQVGPFVVESTGLGYATLAEALAKTNGSGDTITVVEAGTYSGEGNIGVTIAQDVAIKAAEGSDVVFNANGATDSILTIAEGKKVSIDGIDFTGANAAKGGAIYINKDAEVAISNADFTENTASTRGGAIYSEGTLTVSDCTFDKNDITTRNQNVDNGGAAIYNYGGTLTVKDSSFTNNLKDYVIRGTGGATGDLINGIIMSSGATTITGSEFINNSGCYGGAVAVLPVDGSTVSLTVDDCDFINNLAYCGAAIQLENCAADYAITNSRFENNTATGIGSPGYGAAGGAIDILGSSGKGTITNCIFSGNDAPDGAGINVQNGDITVDKCTFMENTGEYAAGLEGWNSKVVVTDSYFIDNAVTGEGAGIYIYGTSTLELTGSVFDGNTAPVNRNIHSRANPSTIERNIFDINETTIEVNNITYGEDEVINGTFDAGVNYDLTGSTVYLTINGAEVTATVIEGNKFTTTVIKPVVGTYPVVFNNVTDSLNNVYLPVNPVEPSYTVNPAVPNLVLTPGEGNITIDVFDGDYPISGNATVIVDGDTEHPIEVTIDETGHAVVPIDAAPGAHTVEVTFAKENYENVTKVATVTVPKVTPIVYVNGTEVEYGTPATINITVTDEEGNPINGTVIVVASWEVGGETQVVELVDGKGQATFRLTGLGQGATADINATYVENDNYTTAYNDTEIIKITPSTELTLDVAANEATFGEDTILTIVAKDGADADVPLTKVNVTVDGVTNEYDVDENGTVNLGKLSIGDHEITVSVDDGFHEEATADVNATVKPAEANVTVTPGEGNVTVEAKDKDGNPINGTAIIVVDGGEPIEVPIDETGKIEYPIDAEPGAHTVEVTFTNPDYENVTKTVVVNVPKYEATLTIANTTEPVYGQNVTIVPTLVPTNATGTITYYVDGSTAGTELAIGENFIVSGLTAGEHTIVAKYNGDGNYSVAESNTLTLNVAKAPLTFEVVDAIAYYPDPGTINVAASADDTFTILVNGVEYSVTVENGKGSVKVNEKLDVGEYDITWNIPDGDNYIGTEGSAKYQVVPAAPDFSIIGSPEINYGQNNTIIPTITEGATGNITYAIGGHVIGQTAVGENFTVEGLDVGEYTIVATYSGDNNYGTVKANFTFKVLPIDVVVSVSSDEVYYPNTGSINLTASAPGEYTVLVGNKTYTATVTTPGETVTIPVTDLFEVGKYDINVTAPASQNYNALDTGAIGTYVVSKAKSVIAVTYDNATCKITVTLEGEEDHVKLSETISVEVDGVAISGAKTTDGVFVSEDLELTPGKHSVFAVFVGNENYLGSYAQLNLDIPKFGDAEVTVSAAPIKEGEDAIINITVKDGDKGLTGVVTVTLDGTNYAVDVTDGIGQLTVKNLVATTSPTTTYPITAKFNGNDEYAEATGTGEINVTDYNDVIIVIAGGEDGAVATLIDTDLNNITGKVNVTVDGVGPTEYDVVDGKVNIPISEEGDHEITVDFAGDETHPAASKTDTVYVGQNLIPTSLTVTVADIKYTEDAEVVVILKDEAGNLISGKVNITIGDASKVVTVTGGHASTKFSGLNANSHTVIAEFASDGTYASCVGTAPFTVKQLKTRIIARNMTTTAINVTEDGRIGQYFSWTLVDEKGRVLADKNVSIGFNANVYNRVTNSSGQARLQINLQNSGPYTFAISFLGDENYEGCFEVVKIDVNKQKAQLTASGATYKASAKTKTLSATYKTKAGNPIVGKTVKFTVNGKTYSAKTDSKGVAKVNVSLTKAGSYTVEIKAPATNTYAETTKKVTLKLT